jgi:hypothetical protein
VAPSPIREQAAIHSAALANFHLARIAMTSANLA